MNINDLSTQLLYSTVPIECTLRNGTSTGTGFFFTYSLDDGKRVPFLVTNYHVIENAEKGSFKINLSDNGEPNGEIFRVDFDNSIIAGSKLGNLDLAAIPVAPVLGSLESAGKEPFYRSIEKGLIPSHEKLEELTALEDITFIGCPSGIYDSVNNTPLIRKGTTSTPVWNDYMGEKCFLIDASVFPGSSGSPAFIFNQGSYATGSGITIGSRLMFVGVVSGTIVRNGQDYLDLGKVIKSSALLAELDVRVSQLLNR